MLLNKESRIKKEIKYNEVNNTFCSSVGACYVQQDIYLWKFLGKTRNL